MPRQRAFLRPITLLLSLALALAGAFSAVSPASAVDTGGIAGVVTGTGDLPLEFVTVVAFRDTGGAWDPESFEATGNNGSYTFAGLPAGTYRLYFVASASAGYAPEYYANAATFATAQDVPVVNGVVTGGRDAKLEPTGHITGTVTGPDGQPVNEIVTVVACRLDDPVPACSEATAQADGTYDISNLATDNYRVGFLPTTYATEWWDNVSSFAAAADVPVVAGATTTGKDAQLELGGHITGSLTRRGGIAAAGVFVVAYRNDGAGWNPVGGVTTLGSGDYDLAGVPSGTYRLVFVDELENRYVTEYWDDAASVETATSIVLAAPETVAGIDARLTAILSNTGQPTMSGAAQVGGTLTASSGTWNHPTGLTTTYQWLVGGTPVAGATSATYTPVAGDLGKSVQVEVTATKTGYTTSTAASRATTVGPGPLTNTALPTISGTAQVGATLTATTGSWNPPTGLTTTYRWLVAGTPVAGATTASYELQAGDVAKSIQVEVTASRPGYTSVVATSIATTATDPGILMNTALPVIGGTAKVGAELSATPGTWFPLVGLTTTYQWLVGGAPIAGATAATYTPTAGDVGKILQVTVTATSDGYTSATATSVATSVGTGTLEVTRKPKVTGKATQGATLKASPGTWSPTATTTYQWYAGSKPITKATTTKLMLTGKTLKAVTRKTITVKLTTTAPGYKTVTTKLKVSGKVT